MVETYLLPLLDRSFVIYFISKEGIDSSIKEKSVRTFLKYSELNGGYPHLIKVADKGYYNKSLKKVVSELKNGRISTVYVQSMIKFFFENDDMNFDF